MKLTKLLLIALTLTISIGCATKVNLDDPSIPMKHEKAIYQFEENYIAEYNATVKKVTYNDEWVQPDNKEEACLTFSSVLEGMQLISTIPNFETYWDGECKDGYAYGLGREFTYNDDFTVITLAEYAGGATEPKYYQQVATFDPYLIEGDLNNGYVVATYAGQLEDGGVEILLGDFVYYEDKPARILEIKTNEREIYHIKQYPELEYYNVTFIGNEESEIYQLISDTNEYNELESLQDYNGLVSYVHNDELVNLPIKFHDKIYDMTSDVTKAALKAIKAREIALQKEAEYTKRICQDDVQPDYMDIASYKVQCNYISNIRQNEDALRSLNIGVNPNFDKKAQKLQKDTYFIIDELIRTTTK